MKKVKVLIDSWFMNKWMSKQPQTVAEQTWGRYSSTGSGGTAWAENWDHITWPGHTVHQQLWILQDVSQSIFLLFVLIVCHSPFCRRTRMGSKESIVSTVQSIRNTSRDSFIGNFYKGVFCNKNRHSLRIGRVSHSHTVHWTERVLIGNSDKSSLLFLFMVNSFRVRISSTV